MYEVAGADGYGENQPKDINHSIHKAKLAEAVKDKTQLPHGAAKS